MTAPVPPRRLTPPSGPTTAGHPTPAAAPQATHDTPAPPPARRIAFGGQTATPAPQQPQSRSWNPFGRQAPTQRPGQPARPAGPAIPATVTLTVNVVTGSEDHRTPVKDAEVVVNDREPVKSGERGSVTLQNIATGGKSISISVSHSGFIGVHRTIRPDRMNITETVVLRARPKIGMGMVLGVIALLAMIPIGVGMFTSTPPSVPSTLVTIQPPPIPQIQPLDLASAAWIGPVQGMVLISGFILIGLAVLDRWLVKQIHDVTVPVVAVVALYVFNWAPIRAALATPPFSFTETRTIGWLVIVASIVAVYAVSKLPTTDYTPSALYVSLLVVVGITVGKLGLLQVAIGIPEASVVSFGQAASLVQHKAWPAVQFSFVIYALCVLAIGLYGWESVKPNEKGAKFSFGGPVFAVLGLVVYYATSRGMIRAGFISDPSLTWLYYAIALLATVLANLAAATLAKEVLSGDVVQTSRSYTDVRIGFLNVRTPWDVIGLEIMMGILLILMFGTI